MLCKQTFTPCSRMDTSPKEMEQIIECLFLMDVAQMPNHSHIGRDIGHTMGTNPCTNVVISIWLRKYEERYENPPKQEF